MSSFVSTQSLSVQSEANVNSNESTHYIQPYMSIKRLTDKQRMFKGLIDDVLLHVKAFDGDVYGGVIRDYRVSSSVYVRDINCRIDGNVLSAFIQSLHLYFDVEELGYDVTGTFVQSKKKLKVSNKPKYNETVLYTSTTPIYVFVDIIVLSRFEWMRLPCDFDVNMFAENSNSLYTRTTYTSLNKLCDKINFIQERIRKKEFCSLEDSYSKTPEQIKNIIDRALRLSMKGWVMDDMLLGEKTWVIAQWSILSNDLKMVRKSYDIEKYNQMSHMTECAICNETFAETDFVINTRCNHNFHWSECCYQSRTNSQSVRCKGLKEWLKRAHITCPICRQFMF